MDEDIRRYIIEEFGRIHPVFESMEKYNPELLKGFITSRRSTLPPKGKPEILSRKVKELIMVAVEVALGRGEKGKSHARKAVRAGATPAEIHEVVSLCQWLAGQATYVDGGMDSVKAAEDEEAKMKAGKDFYWTSEVKPSEEH